MSEVVTNISFCIIRTNDQNGHLKYMFTPNGPLYLRHEERKLGRFRIYRMPAEITKEQHGAICRKLDEKIWKFMTERWRSLREFKTKAPDERDFVFTPM